MTHCRIDMLGPLRVVCAGQIVTRFGTHKAASLLAFLALHPGPQSREQIIDLFWPDMDLSAGRNNLNTALSSLRRVLEPPGICRGTVLTSSHVQVGLNPEAVAVDIAEFEAGMRQAELTDAGRRTEALERTVALYRGDFQVGNYQDWAVREAERLQGLYGQALGGLADSLEAAGRMSEALEAAQRRLSADPYSEATHLGVIRRLMRMGQETSARAAGRRLEQMFREEYGTALPDPVHQALQEAFSQRPAPQMAAAVPAAAVPAAAVPFWLGRFVGRETELSSLLALLAPDEACRLVTLTGPGGTGKTRLAAEASRVAAERLGRRCGFAALADLSGPEQVAAQIAQALLLPPAPLAAPPEQIAAFFQEREARGEPPFLLVLDNLEHLLERHTGTETILPEGTVASLVRMLLQCTSQLTIWCTSRRRLDLSGEQQFPVGPLPVPDFLPSPVPQRQMSPEEIGTLAEVPSVALYLERGRTVRPDFRLTPANAASVAALCRILEGSPLALELAASWVRLLPPRLMEERLAQGEALPEGRGGGSPARHRSVSAALEWSWHLLPDASRSLLARLSVFRGGWTAQNASAVCGAAGTLENLADLQEASLILSQETESGDVRFAMLETVRAFAAARLDEFGLEETREARNRHRDCFAALAVQAYPHMRGPEQAAWLMRLDAEQENLRAALEWAGDSTDTEETGLRMAGALWQFWQRRGDATEGRLWLTRALAQGTTPTEARADALLAAGALAITQGDYAEAEARYEESLAVWRQRGDQAGMSAVLNNLAVIATDRGRYEDARALLAEHIAIRRQRGDHISVARSLFNLGRTWQGEGNWAAAERFHKEALAIRRRVGDEAGIGASLNSLGEAAAARGDTETAAALHAESLAIQRRLDNAVGIADALNGLGSVQAMQGTFEGALLSHREALALRRRIGDRVGGAGSLECLAIAMGCGGDWERATRLLGAAQSLRETLGSPLPLPSAAKVAQGLDTAQSGLGAAQFAEHLAEGRALSWEQAADEAVR